LLDIPLRELEKVLYFESYIVIDPGDIKDLKERELLTDERYRELMREHPGQFVAKMGAEAIKELLTMVKIEELSIELRRRMREETSQQKKLKFSKRLKVTTSFLKSGNHPEWMILDVIPVIPPELRPLVPLDGGRFATSDLNDLVSSRYQSQQPSEEVDGVARAGSDRAQREAHAAGSRRCFIR
jgi:DNA-directed RNA polymerase subunit beta'